MPLTQKTAGLDFSMCMLNHASPMEKAWSAITLPQTSNGVNLHMSALDTFGVTNNLVG